MGVTNCTHNRFVVTHPSGSITSMVEKLADGDYSVVEPLWNRFWIRLKREAAKKAGNLLLRSADEEDIAQCVFVDLVQRIAEKRVARISNRRRLWRLIEISTFHMAVTMHRQDQKTDPSVALDMALADDAGLEEVEPGFFVSLEDDLDKLSHWIDEDAKTIVLMVIHGYQSAEIAKRLLISPRTIQRKMVTIRDAWSKINRDDGRE